jgi:hypothetical protein
VTDRPSSLQAALATLGHLGTLDQVETLVDLDRVEAGRLAHEGAELLLVHEDVAYDLDRLTFADRRVLGLIAVVGAWASMHLAFALHYARLHYRDSGNPNTLSFPNKAEMEPTDLDFAYFAFMIGMAFSGADVTVRGRSLRGWVLIHAVVSFVFNTAILALAINLAFDLL